MKLLLILCFSIFALLADGFKYKQIIKHNTPIDEIVQTIKDVKDGTVLIFENGEYDFENEKIILDNKKYVSIEGTDANKTILSNLSFYYLNSEYTQLKRLTYSKSYFSFESSKNSYTDEIELKESQIAIRFSTASINRITSKTSYKYSPIYIEKSTVTINKCNIENKLGISISSNNSETNIYNSYFSNTKSSSIYSDKSRIDIYNNIFKNDNTFDSKDIIPFIYLNNSQGFIHKNKLDNYSRGIWLANESTAEIFDNELSRLNRSILISTGSKARISRNTIQNGISVYSSGIVLNNGKALIQKNNLTSVFLAIFLDNNAEGQIAKNKIYSLLRNNNKNGRGIEIGKGCISNIWDNIGYSLKRSNIGWADKESKVYLNNNNKGFSLPGIGDPQVEDKPLTFDFVDPYPDFRDKFKKIEIASLKYNDLKLINNTENKKIDEVDIIDGKLKKTITVVFETYDDPIPAGTYVKYDRISKKIIESKMNEASKDIGSEYYKNSREIDEPLLEKPLELIPVFDSKKNLLHYNIKSNAKKLLCNEEKVEKSKENIYVSRAKKIYDFKKVYTVNIEEEGKEKHQPSFECRFSEDKHVTCAERKLEDL